MDSLVLASKSPRRREILQNLNIPYIVFFVDLDEEKLYQDRRSIRSLVIHISKLKVKGASAYFSNGLIIGADTIVYFNRKILGQPKNVDQALKYLKMLSGNRHQIYSGITVRSVKENNSYSSCSVTDVYFSKLSNRQIDSYIEQGEWEGKAGGYAIQGQAALFVNHIVGSYYNVVGLPVEELYRLLNRFNYFSSSGFYRPIKKM